MKLESTAGLALGNPAMDYATLRQEGLRQLERLAGSEWTDFNAHDPGITILEQYCYALTELAYRCDFSLPDLLSREGKSPNACLFSPSQILSSRPVTLTDLRKLAVDVRGVKNAWIEKASPQVFHNREGTSPLLDRQENLIQLGGGEGGTAVGLKGVYRVLIQASEVLGVDSAELVRNVASRLHAHRPLGVDFESVEVMREQKIQVNASIEISPLGNPEDIYVAILGKIAAHISPAVPFYTLGQRLAAGLRIDEIFDGPMLDQGFIDTDELSQMPRKTALRASDFMRDIMDVEGVLMVKHLELITGSDQEEWWLDLAGDKTPVLDIENVMLSLERRQIKVSLDTGNAKKRHLQAQANLAYRPATPEELDIVPPAGRDRRVGRYYSAQHQFPEAYGLGERGLPPQAPERQRAQVRQLQAYLMFFDQLLANQFAQLAHVGDLLGFNDNHQQTYFAGDLDDPSLGLDAAWQQTDADTRRQRLAQIVENPATAADDASPQIDWARKNRFLDHLLARFAEQITDYAQFRQNWPAAPVAEKWQSRLARDKQAWLRRFPQLSASRGIGYNALKPWNEETDPAKADRVADNCSGLEHRLRLKLGLWPGVQQERFYMVEHVLLRPFDADQGQTLPLLADARCADPYSLQISFVFPNSPERYPEGGGFRQFVEQALREETPVHLLVHICWLDEPSLLAFEAAYQTWLDSQHTLRESNSNKALSLAMDSEEKIRLGFRQRDARNRLVDLLGIGHTYPLADLPVRYTETVAWGQSGRISLIVSQVGVLYQLLDKEGKPLVPAVEASGDGSDLVLLTPAITKDTDFMVKATKRHSSLFAVTVAGDKQIHIDGSRLDTRYELCAKDGKSFNPKIQATGNGGELILAPPAGATAQDFTVRAVKSLSLTLFQPIVIKVGLDTSLTAAILEAELLDPAATDPAPTAPRIVNFAAVPRVEIQASQAGVDYTLVRVLASPAGKDEEVVDPKTKATLPLKFISKPEVRGDSHAIILRALPVAEDTDIRILAIKKFGANENQTTQKALLDTTLPLKVRANPALTVAIAQPLLDYRSGASVVVKGSQASARYQLFARPIFDSEFVRAGKDASNFGIAGMAALWVNNPPNPTADAVALGAAKAGNGADLALAVGSLTEDTLVVVSAAKTHQAQDGQTVPSSLQLSQPTAILVRPGPDTDFPLLFKAKDGGAPAAGGGLQKATVYLVLNGQPGVFYHFRLANSEDDLGLPVYFHKAKKGVEQLGIEIDFTITGNLPTPPPEWDCPVDLAADAKLSIRAVKAQTGLEIVFERTVAALLGAA